MKLFIWEGNGISEAYHDDGTLVVLAESPEQARQVVRGRVSSLKTEREAWYKRRDEYLGTLTDNRDWIKTLEGRAIWDACPPSESAVFDGKDAALDREPDRVVELDTPCIVAFNGGGYD